MWFLQQRSRAALAPSDSAETDGRVEVGFGANVKERVWSPEDSEDFCVALATKTERVGNERGHCSRFELVEADLERNLFYLLCCLDFSEKEHLFTSEAWT